MRFLDARSLRVLDFPKMIQLAASLAETTAGRKAVERLCPKTDVSSVRELLEETKEGIELLGLIGSPLSAVKPIDDAVAISRVTGSVLEPEALLNIAGTLQACQALKSRFSKLGSHLQRLRRRVSKLHSLDNVCKAIQAAVGPDCEIRDSASPQLGRIRKQIASTQKQIKETLENILRSTVGVLATQEQYITMRQGRYVLPVKSEKRSELKGVVHDQSASGATVFVEPQETVELNNRVRSLVLQEQREIERILRELTALVGAHADELQMNIELLTEIDCILARARFSSLFDAKMPQITEKGELALIQARHPLLLLATKTQKPPSDSKTQQSSKTQTLPPTSTELAKRFIQKTSKDLNITKTQTQHVVPIDITLGKNYSTLVITGPNTGGKTVALKTCGLLVLLAQSGFLIPAKEDSKIPVYDQVLADIGDEQTIEQSLSTFSSHMNQIVKIVANLSQKSLVLLDEIGAGTDPAEGSALATAILRHLTSKSVHTIATTHHNSLKVFAHNTPRVENASVQFDPVSLSPTYRLVVGLPGSSNAFEIARRLGLPEELITDAKSSLSVESRRVSELLSSLDRQQAVVKARSEELARRTEEAYAIQQELDRSLRFAKERSRQIVQGAAREADELIRRAKSEVRSILASVRARRASGSLGRKEADRAITRLDQLRKDLARKAPPAIKAKDNEAPPISIDQLSKGQNVHVESLDVDGVITNVFRSKQEVEVGFGGIKIRAKIENIRPAPAPNSPQARPPEAPFLPAGVTRPGPELKLIGMTRDEALPALERFLADAALWGLKEVRIVHGIGKGILRATVADVLRDHPLVQSFNVAPPHLGGPGATIVLLKE